MQPMDQSTKPALTRRSSQSGWRTIAVRAGLAAALVVVAFLLLWFDRDGLRDNLDGHLSFTDVIYFTMITITTVGYGDIVPVSDRARLIDAFLITPIRLFIWLIFLGTAFNFLLKRSWEKWRMRMIQKNLNDHIIIAGFGASGRKSLEELLSAGVPVARLVVIDCLADRVEAARELGAATIQGDASRDELLSSAHVERASTLLVSAGRDDTSILIVLTARNLAPKLRIGVAIRIEDNENLAKQAGADVVVNPVSFAGLLLASSSHGSHVADYIADLATSSGKVALRERAVAPAEIGKSLGDLETGLGVRIYRGGATIDAAHPAAGTMRDGDRLLEIVATPDG
ncbi:MAG: potassium channel family protein [Sphingomonas bacterium]|nr:potassium channel family protein [Sphingomonas bacterium]